MEPGLGRLRLEDLDVDLVHFAVNRDLEFQGGLLAEWTERACDAWIVTRPCWAHAPEPTRRICRMWAFLPEEGRDGRADDQDDLLVEFVSVAWRSVCGRGCLSGSGLRRCSSPLAPAWRSGPSQDSASSGRLQRGHAFSQPAQLLAQALQGAGKLLQIRWVPPSCRASAHSGIRPCFLGGRRSRLVCRYSSACARCLRVSAGSMMSSTSRRPAAT